MKKKILFIILLSFPYFNSITAQTKLLEITSDVTWTLVDSPITLPTSTNPDDISVYIENATLTIEEGVQIISTNASDKIIVGTYGRIVANGSESDPIQFWGNGIRSSGSWAGIVFEDYAGSEYENSTFNNVQFYYGGSSDSTGVISIPNNFYGKVEFNNCLFYKNTIGISAKFGRYLIIENSDFNGNEFGAIYFGDAKDAVIRNNYFYNNEYAFKSISNLPRVLEENKFSNSNQEIYLPTFINENTNITIPGYLNDKSVMPYSLGIDDSNSTLTITQSLLSIDAGVVISGNTFGTEKSYIIVTEFGALSTNGEEGNPVLFTSKNPTLTNQWGGIILSKGYNYEYTKFKYTQFNSAAEGAVIIYGGRPTFTNSLFSNNVIGIVADSNSSPVVVKSIFMDNQSLGILAQHDAHPGIFECLVSENQGGIAVYNSSLDIFETNISDNQLYGVSIDDGERIDIASCKIENNEFGVNIESNIVNSDILIRSSTIRYNSIGIQVDLTNTPIIDITENNLSSNENYSINNLSSVVIQAKMNWWGDASGPLDDSDNSADPTELYNPEGLGAEISDFVDYSDWYEFYISDKPNIMFVEDVPNDQGRNVFIGWSTSFYDQLDSELPIIKYSIWRELPIDSPSPEKKKYPKDITLSDNFRSEVENEFWQYIGDVTPLPELNTYIYSAPTLADSNMYYTFYSTFMVVAHTADPLVYYKSDPRSGFSVDNIEPAVPLGFTAVTTSTDVTLNWNKNNEDDFSHYSIYKNDVFLKNTIDTLFIDDEILDGNYVYELSAIDVNGNESQRSELSILVGVDENNKPIMYNLEQNYPNPFNPTTTIKYAVPELSNVEIEIFNTLGERVEMLVNSEKPAGFYDVAWSAKNLPTGVYLISIRAKGKDSKKDFVQVRKAILLK